MNVQNIPVHLIDRPALKARISYPADQLQSLADSIATVGLINPITIERRGERYEIIAGDCRYQAHLLLGRDTITASIIDPGDMTHGEAIKWAENLERANLSPLEEAHYLAQMRDKLKLDRRGLAKLLRRSTDWTDARLELLTIPEQLRNLVHDRTLPLTHALALGRVDDDQHRDYLLRYALEGGASLRIIREWVQQYEVTRDAGADLTQALPPAPAAGQTYRLMMACACCGDEVEHTALIITRICRRCDAVISDATRERFTAPPPAPAPAATAHEELHHALKNALRTMLPDAEPDIIDDLVEITEDTIAATQTARVEGRG